MSHKDHLKNLIVNHNRRLQKLKELQALQGYSVDPAILLEIEDIEAKIVELKRELYELEKLSHTPTDFTSYNHNENIERTHKRSVKIPLLGYIAAGEPIPVFQDDCGSETDMIEISCKWVPKRGRLYGLRVKGSSMIDALIMENDIVVMLYIEEIPKNGQMVAAWLLDRQETTLKRFYHQGDSIRLQPENKNYNPIITSLDNVTIQGRVVTVIRQYNSNSAF
jgi:SOS regulatory protein LexA